MSESVLMKALASVQAGDEAAIEQVMSLAYPELKRMARRALMQERSNHTLQPTALVNEVWLKLNGEPGVFESRMKFFGIAAHAMRQILVSYARQRLAEKRNGGTAPLPLEAGLLIGGGLPLPELLALDEAVEQLAVVDHRKARVVEMRFFAGMEYEEIAEVLRVSARTVKRDWIFARAFLHARIYAA